MADAPLELTEALLDRASSVPLHLQIERLLRRLLQSDAFNGGELLPGEVELARSLSVSRNTLRAAMARLEAEGMIRRKRRVGTIVALPPPHSSLQQWYSLTAEMREQGIEVENLALSVERARPTPEVAEGLDLVGNAPIWKLERVRGWGGEPVVIATSWLHPSLGIEGTEDFNQPLYKIVKSLAGVTPHLSREALRATAATGAEADKLRVVPGTPLLLRSRTIYDRRNRPLEQNYNLYLTDRYHLTLELGNPSRKSAERLSRHRR